MWFCPPAQAWKRKARLPARSGASSAFIQVFDPLGDSRPDWQIIQEIANRLGANWNYAHPSEICAEIASLTPIMAGVTYERLEGYKSLQWPVAADGSDQPLLYTKQFQMPDGKAKFFPLAWNEPSNQQDATYDLHLNNGRLLEHFHEGNMTYKTEGIREKVPSTFVEISPELAKDRGIETGSVVRLTSRYGHVRLSALVTDRVRGNELYMPMNSVEEPVNRLTSSNTDKVTSTPAYKEVSVSMELIDAHGASPLPRGNSRFGHPTPQRGVEVERKWQRSDYRAPSGLEVSNSNQVDGEKTMAQPIPLELPPRNPRKELLDRLKTAPQEHAEALLDAFDLLEELHQAGALQKLRGTVSASDEILEYAVTAAKSPEGTRALRNLLILGQILGSIDPDLLKCIAIAVGESLGSDRKPVTRPPGLLALLSEFRQPELRRSVALINRFLETSGQSTKNPRGRTPTALIDVKISRFEICHVSGASVVNRSLRADLRRVAHGGRGGTRTHNPQLRRLMLYPLELLAHALYCSFFADEFGICALAPRTCNDSGSERSEISMLKSAPGTREPAALPSIPLPQQTPRDSSRRRGDPLRQTRPGTLVSRMSGSRCSFQMRA